MAMPNRRDRGKKTTIIRRQIKKRHAGHHGGAWKVAFADFTLAMMALFMTLWIVNSVSQSERKEIVAALHGQSIFFGGGMVAPLSHLPRKLAAPAESHPQAELKKTHEASSAAVRMRQKSARELGELAKSINEIALKAHMESNLEMEIVPQGLRILIKDNQKRSMFERGSATITPFFRALLTELTPVFNSLDNKLIITGHTDAMRYRGAGYNNWNLSGDRALSARRVMEQAGMPGDKVMQVSAMADRMLLDAHNPDGAGNRRIEIMILTRSASDTLYQFFGAQGEKVVKPLASRLEQNPVQQATHGPD